MKWKKHNCVIRLTSNSIALYYIQFDPLAFCIEIVWLISKKISICKILWNFYRNGSFVPLLCEYFPIYYSCSRVMRHLKRYKFIIEPPKQVWRRSIIQFNLSHTIFMWHYSPICTWYIHKILCRNKISLAILDESPHFR